MPMGCFAGGGRRKGEGGRRKEEGGRKKGEGGRGKGGGLKLSTGWHIIQA